MARLDWEILIRCWNGTIAQLQQWQSEGRKFGHPDLDGFIAWYLKLIISIQLNRQTIEFDDLSRGAWKDPALTDQLVHTVQDYNDSRITKAGNHHFPRNTAHFDWLRTIPAIFAPEFGLHEEVVRPALRKFQGIYFSYQPRASTKELPGIAYLELARSRLWQLSSKSKPEVANTLRRIDAEHPQHPWVVLMREPSKPLD